VSQRLDSLDLSIIEVLERNGRTSNRSISRELGVSEGTVRSRIRRLQEEGLLRIIAVRNISAGGYVSAHLGILVEAGRLREVAEAVAALPEAVFTAIAVGHYDVVAMLLAEGRGAVAAVVNDRIATLPGVRRVESTEAVASVKFVPNLRKLR
jgi:Lrp/AsnC family transcriptional regulator for asnA, asnC and gidA